ELRERLGQSALDACGERFLAGLPVESNELTEFVRPLDDLRKRIRHQGACALAPGQLPHQEEWNMAKLHLVTGLASERCYVFRLVARHEFRETLRDVVALFIERVFPEQACQHASPQLTPRIDMLCHRSCVRPCRKHPLPHI